MEYRAILSIQGQQIYSPNEEPEVTQLVTEAVMTLTEEEITLRYEETELTGLEGTTTTFSIRPGFVTLLRQGQVNSEMVFEQGRRHLSMYSTPYGTMSVGINTRRMVIELDETGGNLEIDYSLEINHAVASENIFSVFVKVKP